jgi:hypothetical protein
MTQKNPKNLSTNCNKYLDDAHLGEQFIETLDKIEPAVAQLHEATKTIHEQVEIFKSLSQTAQEQIKSSLKEATKNIAETVAKDIASATEKQIHGILEPLDRSAQYALRALHDTKLRKRLRVTVFFCLAFIVVGMVGFGAGYIYAKKPCSELPRGQKHDLFKIQEKSSTRKKIASCIVRTLFCQNYFYKSIK